MTDTKFAVYKATPVYIDLAGEEDELEMPVAADFSSAYNFSVSKEWHHISEARNLTWTDDFFEHDEEIVAVFDLDYEAMESFYTSIGWVCYGLTLLYTPVFVLATLVLTPFMLRRNVKWVVNAKHVAITRDGIKFVEDRRKCGWGFACCDVGKNSKTVPFDKIIDVDIQEPAGNECICIPQVLFKVRIDTASSSQDKHELVLAGLKNPYEFKKLVWAMKRMNQQLPYLASATKCLQNQCNSIVQGHLPREEEGNVAELLREIRDELRQNNEVLRAINPRAVQADASAPIEEDVRLV